MLREAMLCVVTGCALAGAIALTSSTALSAEEGQVQFNNRCRTCHSVREDDNRQGPSLHNLIGRKAGSLGDYPLYSQAMRNSGVVWNEENLDEFIASPDTVIPGNNMKPYAGIDDQGEREQIVKYLATLRPE
jgi:cytochrome c